MKELFRTINFLLNYCAITNALNVDFRFTKLLFSNMKLQDYPSNLFCAIRKTFRLIDSCSKPTIDE